MELMDAAAVTRLEAYFASLGDLLGNDARRASFATYAFGLFSDGERKSVEPMSSRACPDPRRADAAHQSLLHFVGVSRWSDRHVRRHAAAYALEAMRAREGKIEALILDDTGFLKQGKHSAGVQRQYTGTAGKVTNCQVGVSLTAATRTEHLPIDFELYLPEFWATDPALRKKARIPDEVTFKTKPQLGLEMVRRALADGISPAVVLGDASYGSSELRSEIRKMGLHYAVGVNSTAKVWELGKPMKRGGASVTVRDLAFKLQKKGRFRRCTWRQGTKEDLTARFAMRRVLPCIDKNLDKSEREAVWLLIEWRDGESEPANYFFSSLPKSMRKKPLIRLVMQRWRIERTYEDMKGELGLDHYEGRSFPGWHHHVSVVLSCYAFIVTERVRRFPPSARGAPRADPQLIAA